MGGETRYARSGDLSIAYRVLSDEGVDLLVVPGFVSHVEVNFEETTPPALLLNPLTRFARCVIFDKRGTGMSDRDLGTGAFEDRMDDVRAVMDAVGLERTNLMGWSEGVPMSLLFAATHPDRVERLVLYSGFARWVRAPDYPIGVAPDVVDFILEGIHARWGEGDGLKTFAQHWPEGRAGDEASELAARAERLMCTPRGATELMRSNLASDVRAVLPLVRQPTLVVHNADDPLIPVAHSRYLAEHLPNALYVETPGDFHMSWRPEVYKPIHDAIEEFLTGRTAEGAPEPDPVLATVLFTDIVSSTQRASDVGDQRWRELLDTHDRAIAREVERFRGRVVKTTGDGVLATFDGPARAIRCACAIRDEVRRVGLEIRAGLHTGEVEVRGEDLAGIAVHIGARVGSLAGAGEVLVSRTVADLVAGSGLAFDDRGEHELKGVPGTWGVLAVSNS